MQPALDDSISKTAADALDAWCYQGAMFTGLVETLGHLRGRQHIDQGQRLTFEVSAWDDLRVGESISVEGVCLTASEISAQGFAADISPETDQKTTLGRLAVGAPVNLERALRVGDRLGGHMVMGHVDQVVMVSQVETGTAGVRVWLALGQPLLSLVVPKGSVCLNGVSLTVNAVHDTGFDVMLIPHTLAATTLKGIAPGSELNFEADVLARYAVRGSS